MLINAQRKVEGEAAQTGQPVEISSNGRQWIVQKRIYRLCSNRDEIERGKARVKLAVAQRSRYTDASTRGNVRVAHIA